MTKHKGFYSQSAVDQLRRGYAKVRPKFNSLLIHFVTRRTYVSARGRELAENGLARRLKVMVRCVENVFRLLPLDQTEVPIANQLADATINVHAFILNVFGAVDNLAGILAKEKGFTDHKGKPLSAGQIGFTKKHERLRSCCSPEFQRYLSGLDAWFEYLEGFRHALAHRVPPYFPPYQVPKQRLAEYQAIEAEQAKSPIDSVEHEKLETEKLKLAQFRPEILHSFSEKSPIVVIHAQMLADFNTIEELAYKVDTELT